MLFVVGNLVEVVDESAAQRIGLRARIHAFRDGHVDMRWNEGPYHSEGKSWLVKGRFVRYVQEATLRTGEALRDAVPRVWLHGRPDPSVHRTGEALRDAVPRVWLHGRPDPSVHRTGANPDTSDEIQTTPSTTTTTSIGPADS